MLKKSLIPFLIACATLLLPGAAVHAAISFDASSTKAFGGTTTATATITVGSGGSNQMLVIGIAASGTSATAVKVDGNAATKAIQVLTTGQNAELWYYPVASGSHTVSSTFGANASGTLILSSYYGVASSSPIDATSSASASSKTPSSSITLKTANDFVVDMVAYVGSDSYSAIGSGQTAVGGTAAGNTYEKGLSSYKSTPATGATSTSWTITASNVRWEEVQAALVQVNPVPTLSSLSPTSTGAGGSNFSLTVTGTNFIPSSTVNWFAGGSTTTLATVYNSPTQVTATVTAGLIAATGTAAVSVTNPTPGGGTSGTATFTITTAVPAYTWTNGGGNGLWNTATNWQGGKVPGATSTVIFSNVNTANCTINANVNVAGIQIQTGYTGTLIQSSTYSITVGTSSWTQSDGKFIGSPAGDAITDAGSFTLASGTVTSTSGSFMVMGNFTFSGGTFNHNNGTMILAPSSTTAVASGTATFYTLQVGAYNYGQKVTLTVATGTTLNVQNIFNGWANNDAMVKFLGGGTIAIQGNIETQTYAQYATSTVSFLVNGTGAQVIGDDTLSGGGYYPTGQDDTILSNLTINKTSGSLSFKGYVSILGNYTNSSTITFTPDPASYVFFGPNWPLRFVYATDTLANYTATITGSSTFANVLFGADEGGNGTVSNSQFIIATGTTITAQGALGFVTIYTSVQLLGGGTMAVQGNILQSYHQSYATSTATLLVNGTGDQFIGTPFWACGTCSLVILPTLTVAKSSGIAYMESGVQVTGSLTVNQGELQLATSTATSSIEVDGVLTVASGARLTNYALTSSTIKLSSVVNNGLVWFDGGGVSCLTALPVNIQLTSTSSAQVGWSGSGNVVMRYVNADHQGGTIKVNDYNGKDGGSNNATYWKFPTGGSASLVQMVTSTVASGKTITLTFPFAPRVGDLIVIPESVRNIGSTYGWGFSDTAGNTSYYITVVGTATNNNGGIGVSYMNVQATTSTFSITLNTAANGDNGTGSILLGAFDYTGMSSTSTLDSTAFAGGWSVPPITSGVDTGTTANELYFGVMSMDATTTASASAGWTNEIVFPGTATYQPMFVEDLSTSTMLTTSASWTNSTSTTSYAMLLIFHTPFAKTGYPATGTLDSAVYDTKSVSGAQLNSVTWSGPSLPSDSKIGFQFAVSNSASGPWTYKGPSGDATTWFGYGSAPGTVIPLKSNTGGAGYAMFNGYRYYRYRLFLFSSSDLQSTPVVSGVTVNWSP